MYIYICMYVCMYIHTYICIFIYLFMYLFMWAFRLLGMNEVSPAQLLGSSLQSSMKLSPEENQQKKP